MVVNLATSSTATRKLNEEQQGLLHYLKNLFRFNRVLLFPRVSGGTLQPVAVEEDRPVVPFFQADAVEWLNYYNKTLHRSDLETGSKILDLFDQYDLDRLYPIRIEKECYGFLGIGAAGKAINQIEHRFTLLVLRYFASYWYNREMMREVDGSTAKTRKLLDELSTLLEITRAVEAGGDIQLLLETIMEKCMSVMKVEAVSLMLMTPSLDALEFRVALGPKGKQVKRFKIQLGQGIAGYVAKTGQSLLIPDAYADKRFDPSFDKRSGFVTHSILCVPMTHRGKIIGVVQALNRFDGRPFNAHDLRTFTIFAGQAALSIQNSRLLFRALENEKLKSQIAVASEIQRLIVPEKIPEVPGLQLSGLYIPSQGIGGDFYNVIPINDKETFFCIADVSGKSVPGALLVSTLHATLRAYLEFSNDIDMVMDKLNRRIIELSTSDRFITLFLARYNHETRQLCYISAGHNPQYLLRTPFEVIPLQSTGICVGIIPYEYKKASVKLQQGDLIIFYTDGIVEACNPEREMFGEERLEKLLYEHRNKSIDAIRDAIVKDVKTFCAPDDPQDDLTLLLVKINEEQTTGKTDPLLSKV